MAVETHIYDNKFFKNTIKLEADSAAQFVEVVLKYYAPGSIVDIGCGAGLYLKEFARRGIKRLTGLDGSPAAREEFLLSKSRLVIFDLAEKYNFKKKYDLGLCLEVAEHLRAEDADILVETVTAAADNIIFTAAAPGQGPRSLGHINEQPPGYWIEKFKRKNFSYLDSRTAAMKKEMKTKGVVWWLVNNLLVFSKIN
ncbi:MAG: methyltransferase domain-containing protein [bacterium]|nr:methyltransferase domain-containing protein [bacterium]